jgi:hypothetical protein
MLLLLYRVYYFSSGNEFLLRMVIMKQSPQFNRGSTDIWVSRSAVLLDEP